MNVKILKSIHRKALDYDLQVIYELYKNVDQNLSEVISSLPCDLSEAQVKVRYFRHPKDTRKAGNSIGTNFNYFFTKGGAKKINPHKQDELKWVLGV